MVKFLLLHISRWTSILLLCAIALAAGIFLLDFRHTINSDVKMNFIYTCAITLAVIPITALLLGALKNIKRALVEHKQKQQGKAVAGEVV